ncbi:hypothetical protein LJC14_03835 [Treponema sp. OttesenSCG-928-L16]|nr:hypothetical protein [Treponema sp. OttesenSCG-928-L16]
MQKSLPLMDHYTLYVQDQITRKKLESTMFEYILNNRNRFGLYSWEHDLWVDYLAWLYPRLCRCIDRYKNKDSSFDAYIGSIIKWSAKEYLAREADHGITEQACWTAKSADQEVLEEEPEYGEITAAFSPVPNPRQVMALLLKCYYFISEDFIARAAPAVGVNKEKLRALVDKLRILRLEKEEEIRGLQERITCQFYRCMAFEQRMKAAPEGSARREHMEKSLGNARKRLQSMRKRLASFRLEASNREVAEVLGIPKGTVDSNLYALKWKWKRRRE